MTVQESGLPNTTGSPGTMSGLSNMVYQTEVLPIPSFPLSDLSENDKCLIILTPESCIIAGNILESCMRCPPHPVACKDTRYCDGATWDNALCSRQYTELHGSREALNEETWNASCGMLAGNHQKSPQVDGAPSTLQSPVNESSGTSRCVPMLRLCLGPQQDS